MLWIEDDLSCARCRQFHMNPCCATPPPSPVLIAATQFFVVDIGSNRSPVGRRSHRRPTTGGWSSIRQPIGSVEGAELLCHVVWWLRFNGWRNGLFVGAKRGRVHSLLWPIVSRPRQVPPFPKTWLLETFQVMGPAVGEDTATALEDLCEGHASTRGWVQGSWTGRMDGTVAILRQ